MTEFHLFGRKFWLAAVTRAVRTIAQTVVAMIPATAVLSEVDWVAIGSAGVLAGVLSLLTSVGTGLPEAD